MSTFDLIDAIKVAFKSKPITITVKEELNATAYLVSRPTNKAMLDRSIAQLDNGETVLVKYEDL